MPDIDWWFFIAASVAVILTPGQDLLLVMSRSVTQGAAAGITTAAGVSSGLMVHTALATAGVGAIVMASQWLYLTMKYVGAAYLVYLGVSLLMVKDADLSSQQASARSLSKVFFDGAFSNMANPKIAIFFFAFLPQFVSVHEARPAYGIFLLGASFAILTFVIKAPVGFYAGRLSDFFRRSPVYLLSVYRLSGGMLVLLGLKLIFDEHDR